MTEQQTFSKLSYKARADATGWTPPDGLHLGSTRCRHRAVHSVVESRRRHHSQAFECRIRDGARASWRAAALPMRFGRGRGRRDWAP
ncbi:hypothetical protein [Streptomyces narbonensis]|uniref:hypothetical protein n=1 Tax=Streptomyces narbonensis TaxID=67333 RepID=UPI003403A619